MHTYVELTGGTFAVNFYDANGIPHFVRAYGTDSEAQICVNTLNGGALRAGMLVSESIDKLRQQVRESITVNLYQRR
jgi:hypothetical protein